MGEYSEAFVAFDVVEDEACGGDCRWRAQRRGAVSRRYIEFAGGGGAADPQAGRPVWQAAFLLRGGADRVRAVSADPRLSGTPAW